MNHYLSLILATIYNQVSKFIPADTSARIHNISLKINRPQQQNFTADQPNFYTEKKLICCQHCGWAYSNRMAISDLQLRKNVVQYANTWPVLGRAECYYLMLWNLFYFSLKISVATSMQN